MSVKLRIHEIESAAREYAFVQRIVRVDETWYSIKYRLHIDADLFVHVYFNERSGTAGMALIDHGQRVYGRDCYAGQWHRHSKTTSHGHDHSPEGQRAVTIREFLAEVQELLIADGLI